MIKELKNKLVILAVVVVANSLLAGSFSHVTDTTGTYSANVTLPNAGTCTQICDSYESNNGTINYGPLADLSVNGIGYKEADGPVSAGTYSIYQSVTQTAGGESSTYINW